MYLKLIFYYIIVISTYLMYVRHQKVIFFNIHSCQMAEIL